MPTDPAHRQPPIAAETTTAEQTPAQPDACGCSVQRNCSALNSTDSVDEEGLRHLAPKGVKRIANALKVLFGRSMAVSLVPLSRDQLERRLVNLHYAHRERRDTVFERLKRYIGW